MWRAAVFWLISCILSACPAVCRTWHVNPDGSGDAPTIQAAIDSASGGDIILLANGVFAGPGNRDVEVNKPALTIASESGNPELTVIDCEGSASDPHRGFIGPGSGMMTLSGITIANGYCPRGSAVLCQVSGAVDATDCHFVFNHATSTAALDINTMSHDTRFTNCVFSENWGNYGGAVYVYSHFSLGNAYFDDCTFTGNYAEKGAVAYVQDDETSEEGAVFFTGCTVVLSSSPTFVFCGDSAYGFATIHFDRCILAYNYARLVQFIAYVYVRCTAAYENAYGTWWGMGNQDGINGNFTACPSFCNAFSEPYDLHLCDESPCLPGNHPDGVDCGLIGAWDVGCSCGPSRAEPTTWGAIKAVYR